LADREIRGLLIRSYEKAKQLLKKHRSALDRLASEVLKREEIAGSELDALFASLVPAPAA